MMPSSQPPDERLRLKASHVYLDASIYRSNHFDWDGRWLSSLAGLARRGLVGVVVTDITRREVASLMREMWAETNKSVQRSTVMLGQIGLSEAVSVMADEEACVAKMQAAFEQWLRSCNGWTCKYDPNLPEILDDYFGGNAPFGPGRKKAEFPDAIVASMLKAWCSTTGQSVYVVSQDGDLKACCSPDGPLICAASVAEVVSHGTASAAVHDAVTTAVQESEWFFQQMKECVAELAVNMEGGYRHSGRIDVEAEFAKLEGMGINEVIVDDFDGTNITCSASLTGEIAIRARVDHEAVQYGEHEWDPGYRHTQWINVAVDLVANVTASLVDNGSIEFADAFLDQRSISISWRDIERAID